MEKLKQKLNIKYIDMDSINFSIENKVLKGNYLSASISILPKNTVSYNPNHSIYSAFYLKPYVRGNIENPKYYFENFNRKKAYELDLLLLTQGWSKYSWDNIFNNNFKPYFKFENGITINGSINNKLDKIESLLLYPNSYNNARFISFDKDRKFTLKNYYPGYGEDFKLSIIDKRGNTKPPLLAANSINYIKRDSINIKFLTKKTKRKKTSNPIPLNFLNGDSELLDEVIVSSRLNRVFKKVGPPFQGKIIKINDTIVKRHITLNEILNQHRFIVKYGSDISISSLDKRSVFFYVDGNLVPNMHDFLSSMTSKHEDVYIDYSYNNVLVRGRNYPESILVNVFSRETPFKNSNLNSYPYKNIKLKYAFEPKKEFYSPKYIDFGISAFNEYGILHWYSDINLSKNSSKKFTFLNTGAKIYNLFFEGISENGELISIHKVLVIR